MAPPPSPLPMFVPPTLLPLTVDVFADLSCPWCYIGERHLRRALADVLAEQPGRPLVRRWHPFLLRPSMPREGRPWADFEADTFGSPDRAADAYRRVAEAGSVVGIDFAFDRLATAPNTRAAHRVVLAAGERAFEVAHRLFQAHFEEGEPIGDDETLVRLAADAGLDEATARAALVDAGLDAEIDASMGRARRLNVTGVPFVLLGQRVGVPGAQTAGVFRHAIEKADELAGETRAAAGGDGAP